MGREASCVGEKHALDGVLNPSNMLHYPFNQNFSNAI